MAYSTKGLLLGLFGGSDYARWSRAETLKESWDARTRLIATLVPPGAKVIEFGAGNARMQAFLPTTCTYLASDIVRRTPDMLVCDLNVPPLPDLGALGVDTAVFSGVLEYVHDLRHLFTWIGCHTERCIFSYHCAHDTARRPSRWIERVARLGHGWFNSYSEKELQSFWTSAGFARTSAVAWSSQQIFVLQKHSSVGGSK